MYACKHTHTYVSIYIYLYVYISHVRMCVCVCVRVQGLLAEAPRGLLSLLGDLGLGLAGSKAWKVGPKGATHTLTYIYIYPICISFLDSCLLWGLGYVTMTYFELFGPKGIWTLI